MMKRITALFMTALMVLSMMTANVFAANDGKITVYDATKGAEYSIYKIFDLEYTNNSEVKDSYVYEINLSSEWLDFAKTAVDTNGNKYVTIEDCDTNASHAHVYPGSLSESNAAEFAVKAKQYADTHSITPTGTLEAQGTKVYFENLTHGYYLILSTASTAAVCMLGNTDTEAVIKDKNYAPLISKWAMEKNKWEKANDGYVGEVLNFKIEVIAEENPVAYTIRDSMDAGLLQLVQNSITVNIYRDNEKLNELVHDGTHYTVTALESGFDVIFKGAGLNLLKTDDIIRVEYKAFLNPTENVGYENGGHYNTATLLYGNNKTTSDTTRTYTYELPLYKYAVDEDGTTKIPLDGAYFVITNTGELGHENEYMQLKDNVGNRIEKWANKDQSFVVDGSMVEYYVEDYYIDWVKDQDKATVFISGHDGKINIKGVDAGGYHFYEVDAPEGYSKLPDSVIATIKDLTTGSSNIGKINNGTTLDDGKDYVMIENKKGIALPETGGIGRTIFYVAGGAMVLGAAAMLITKKRSENK